ncbi:MAG: TPM domain-containing protein [Bacilli bacterium]|nr:TPM domain-containing protein [Bacilli bacterium]
MKKTVKKLLFLLIIISLVTPVFAKEPTTCDRSSKSNLGVNKKWKITDKNRGNVLNAPCVDASEKIYDFSGVLSEEDYDQLKKQLEEYTKETKMDAVIIIADIPYSNDGENEDYAADFYDYNDFGIDFDKYSGTLFLRNTYEADPYYDIYTFGNAQLYYDYDRLQVILDGVYDEIHNGEYLEGFTKYIGYLNSYYKKGVGLKNYTVDENGFLHKEYVYPFAIVFIISCVITLVIMLILVKKNKMVMKATKAEAYLDQSSIQITNKQDQFLSTHTTKYTTSSSSGGGGSHMGSSGGGHSSGGGRHG